MTGNLMIIDLVFLLVPSVRLCGTNTALLSLTSFRLDSSPAPYEQSLGLPTCALDGRSVLLPLLIEL